MDTTKVSFLRSSNCLLTAQSSTKNTKTIYSLATTVGSANATLHQIGCWYTSIGNRNCCCCCPEQAHIVIYSKRAVAHCAAVFSFAADRTISLLRKAGKKGQFRTGAMQRRGAGFRSARTQVPRKTKKQQPCGCCGSFGIREPENPQNPGLTFLRGRAILTIEKGATGKRSVPLQCYRSNRVLGGRAVTSFYTPAKTDYKCQ